MSINGVVVPIINGTPGTPGTPQVVPGAVFLEGVACPSATTCLAVGVNFASDQGVVAPITNGTLGTPLVVSGTADLYGMACPSATTCEAVGYNASFEGVVAVVLHASSTDVPLSVGLCQHGGWQNLLNEQGQPFGNQGQCISYLTHNP